MIPKTVQRIRIPLSQQAAMVEVLIKSASENLRKSGAREQEVRMAIEGASRAIETLRWLMACEHDIRTAVPDSILGIEWGGRR